MRLRDGEDGPRRDFSKTRKKYTGIRTYIIRETSCNGAKTRKPETEIRVAVPETI